MAKDKNLLPPSHSPPPYRAIQLDLEKYKPFLDDHNIADTDKEQLLEALWNIVVSFVKLGYGVHPVQQAQEIKKIAQPPCGKLRKNSAKATLREPFELYSKDQSRIETYAADNSAIPSEKET